MSADSIALPTRFKLGFLYALLPVILTGCGDIYRYLKSGEVGWAINQEIRSRHQSEIALASLSRFLWDELVIFSAYTPRDEVCQRLRLNERDCASAELPEPDNDELGLLVFRLNGKIVHHEIHLGWHGEFDADDRQTFTTQNAIFRVEPSGTLRNGQPRFILRWRSDIRN